LKSGTRTGDIKGMSDERQNRPIFSVKIEHVLGLELGLGLG